MAKQSRSSVIARAMHVSLVKPEPGFVSAKSAQMALFTKVWYVRGAGEAGGGDGGGIGGDDGGGGVGGGGDGGGNGDGGGGLGGGSMICLELAPRRVSLSDRL